MPDPTPTTAAGRLRDRLRPKAYWYPLLDEALAEARQQERERIRTALVQRFCDCGQGKHRPTWAFCKAHQMIAILDAGAKEE